jgi:membrane protein DedA with SNARE-associated domain
MNVVSHEFFPPPDTLTLWLLSYGSFILFFMLSLGILAMPIPEETLMVLAGVLMNQGKLGILSTVLFCYAGTFCGISTSYLLGMTAGSFFLTRYGKWIGMSPERLQKARVWFEHLGKWLLLIGYFIPGLRHLTGFSAGAARMKFSQFAFYAYSGAVVWVSIFLSLGYFLGSWCLSCYEKLDELDLLFISLLILGFCFIVYLIKRSMKKNK